MEYTLYFFSLSFCPWSIFFLCLSLASKHTFVPVWLQTWKIGTLQHSTWWMTDHQVFQNVSWKAQRSCWFKYDSSVPVPVLLGGESCDQGCTEYGLCWSFYLFPGFVKKSCMFFGNCSKQEGWRNPNISWVSSPFWHHFLLLSKLFFALQEVLEPQDHMQANN